MKLFYKGIQTLPLKLIWRSVIRLHWFIETKALHKKDPNHSSGARHRFWVNLIVKRNMKMFLSSILLKNTHLTLKGNSPTRKRSRWVSDISVGSYTINASSWATKRPANLKHVSQKNSSRFPLSLRIKPVWEPSFPYKQPLHETSFFVALWTIFSSIWHLTALKEIFNVM